jgi:hypothetical protein
LGANGQTSKVLETFEVFQGVLEGEWPHHIPQGGGEAGHLALFLRGESNCEESLAFILMGSVGEEELLALYNGT